MWLFHILASNIPLNSHHAPMVWIHLYCLYISRAPSIYSLVLGFCCIYVFYGLGLVSLQTSWTILEQGLLGVGGLFTELSVRMSSFELKFWCSFRFVLDGFSILVVYPWLSWLIGCVVVAFLFPPPRSIFPLLTIPPLL